MNEPHFPFPNPHPLVVIVGPTASGKSALAMEVARRFEGEIIAADSRTVYLGMDIGTAKPTHDDRAEVEHHLLDVANLSTKFTAAEFQRQAQAAINLIVAKGKLPILVGGSGLYIDSILFNYKFGDKADIRQREKLNKLTVAELTTYCLNEAILLPLNVKNKRHLIRAIEQRGINTKCSKHIRANTVVVGILIDKEVLKQRITDRARVMFKNGVVQETLKLSKVYGWDSEAMTGNVYPVIRRLLEGELTQAEAIEHFIASDVRLAKKQMTWFRRNQNIHWFSDEVEALSFVEHFLNTTSSVV